MRYFIPVLTFFLTISTLSCSLQEGSFLKQASCFSDSFYWEVQSEVRYCESLNGNSGNEISNCLETFKYLISEEHECVQFFHEDFILVGHNAIMKNTNYLTKIDPIDNTIEFDDGKIEIYMNNIDSWYGELAKNLDFFSAIEIDEFISEQIQSLDDQFSRVVLNKKDTSNSINEIIYLINAFAKYLGEDRPNLFHQGFFLGKIDQHISFLTNIHELNCHISSCKAQNLDENILGKYISLLAFSDFNTNSLNNNIELLSQSAENTKFNFLNSEFFSMLSEKLDRKIDNLDDLTSVDSDKLPRYIRDLVRVYANNSIRLNNMMSHGSYTSNRNTDISFGFGKNSLNIIQDTLSSKIDENKFELDTKRLEKKSFLNNLKQNIQANKNRDLLMQTEKRLKYQLSVKTSEMLGIQSQIAESENLMSRYLLDLENLKLGIDDSDFVALELKGSSIVSTSANDITYTTDRNLRNIAFNTVVNEGDASRVYKISVEGNWSPTCAISKSGLPMGENAITGPEGYMLVDSGSQMTVNSVSESNRTTRYEDRCFSASLCIKGEYPTGMGSTKITASACANYSKGRRDEKVNEHSNTKSDSTTSTASFSKGIRLEHTPYPLAPAGSLLVAIVQESEKKSNENEQNNEDKQNIASERNKYIEDARSIQVVGRQQSLILGKGEKAYFFANDCDSTENNDETQLTLNISEFISQNTQIAGYLDAMYSAISDKNILSEINELIDRGVALPAEINALRTKLFGILAAKLIGKSTIPSLDRIFEMWTSEFLLQVERKTAIVQYEKSIRELTYELDKLESTRAFDEKNDEIQSIIVNNLLQQSSIRFLEEDFYKLSEFVNKVALPAISIHYPEMKNSRLLIDELQTLSNYGLETDFLQVAHQYIEVLKEIKSGLDYEKSMMLLESENIQEATIAVAIPHPDYYGDSELSKQYTLPLASFDVAQAIWSAIGDEIIKDSTDFILNPSDIYQNVADYRLTCTRSRVVIKNMAIVLGMEVDDVDLAKIVRNNAFHPSVDIMLGPEVTFINRDQAKTYQFVNRDSKEMGISYGLGVRLALESEVDLMGALTSNENSNAGKGLSPFTSYKLSELSGLNSYFSELCSHEKCLNPYDIKTIYLSFSVKYQANNTPWLGCKNGEQNEF